MRAGCGWCRPSGGADCGGVPSLKRWFHLCHARAKPPRGAWLRHAEVTSSAWCIAAPIRALGGPMCPSGSVFRGDGLDGREALKFRVAEVERPGAPGLAMRLAEGLGP